MTCYPGIKGTVTFTLVMVRDGTNCWEGYELGLDVERL